MTEMLILFSPIAAGGVRTVIYLFILLRLLVSKTISAKQQIEKNQIIERILRKRLSLHLSEQS